MTEIERTPRTARRDATWTAVAGLAWILAGCTSSDAPDGRAEPGGAALSVEAVVATVTEVDVGVEVSGSVLPWASVSPGSKILGRVEEVRVREGDRVAKGDRLARLESRDLEAVVAQAVAAVTMAEARLEESDAQFRRMTELHGRGSITDRTLEEATAGFRVASAAVAQAESNLAAAEVTLDYAEIRAPRSGFVTRKNIETGDMAIPGAPMFVIDDLSAVKVVASVPESEVAGLREGSTGIVRVDALDLTVEATVGRLVPAGHPGSRTFDAHLRLENADGRLKSGMFARVSFPRGRRAVLAVPRGALVRRGQLTGLFVVEDDRARLRWVRTGREHDERVEILSGLAEGDRFVASPPPALADGSAVETD